MQVRKIQLAIAQLVQHTRFLEQKALDSELRAHDKSSNACRAA